MRRLYALVRRLMDRYQPDPVIDGLISQNKVRQRWTAADPDLSAACTRKRAEAERLRREAHRVDSAPVKAPLRRLG